VIRSIFHDRKAAGISPRYRLFNWREKVKEVSGVPEIPKAKLPITPRLQPGEPSIEHGAWSMEGKGKRSKKGKRGIRGSRGNKGITPNSHMA